MKSSFGFFAAYLFFPLPPSPPSPPPPPPFLLQAPHLCFAASGIWKMKLCSSYFFFICFYIYRARVRVYICVWGLCGLFGFCLFVFLSLNKMSILGRFVRPLPTLSVMPRLSVFPQL